MHPVCWSASPTSPWWIPPCCSDDSHVTSEAPSRILATRHADGVAGAPVLWPHDCLDALVDWCGAFGAQSLLRREADRVDLCADAVGIDVDTPEALQQVRDQLLRARDLDDR